MGEERKVTDGRWDKQKQLGQDTHAGCCVCVCVCSCVFTHTLERQR